MSHAVGLLVARICLAIVFVMSGLFKVIENPAATAYIAAYDLPVPGLLSWAAGVLELAAGAMLIIGFHTRLAAVGLAVFSVVVGVIFHANALPLEGASAAANAALTELHMIMVMKNVAMAGGLIALAVAGAGALSLDGRRRR